jgi:hypothetical protein
MPVIRNRYWTKKSLPFRLLSLWSGADAPLPRSGLLRPWWSWSEWPLRSPVPAREVPEQEAFFEPTSRLDRPQTVPAVSINS